MDLKKGTKNRGEIFPKISPKNGQQLPKTGPKLTTNRLRIAIEVKKGAQNS
jgi:hypothetical protein